MDIIFELIFDLIVEGSLELGTNRKVPMPIRIIASVILLAILGAFLALFGYLTYEMWHEGNDIGAAVMGAVTVLVAILIFFGLRKKYREHKEDE